MQAKAAERIRARVTGRRAQRQWLLGFHAWAQEQSKAVPLWARGDESYWFGVLRATFLATDKQYDRLNRRDPLGAIHALAPYEAMQHVWREYRVDAHPANRGYLTAVSAIAQACFTDGLPKESYGELMAVPWEDDHQILWDAAPAVRDTAELDR